MRLGKICKSCFYERFSSSRSTRVTFSFEHPTTRGRERDLKCQEKGRFHWRLNYCDFMCLTFLHCVFSIGGCEIPGKGRFLWSLFYIDCILYWLHLFNFFIHCVFSNVFSNHLPERWHSRIGNICLPFFHCVFSNVASNHLPQVCPQMACLRGCIVTLVAFVRLFSIVCFQMCP